jgi:hypothetical protein
MAANKMVEKEKGGRRSAPSMLATGVTKPNAAAASRRGAKLAWAIA